MVCGESRELGVRAGYSDRDRRSETADHAKLGDRGQKGYLGATEAPNECDNTQGLRSESVQSAKMFRGAMKTERATQIRFTPKQVHGGTAR